MALDLPRHAIEWIFVLLDVETLEAVRLSCQKWHTVLKDVSSV